MFLPMVYPLLPKSFRQPLDRTAMSLMVILAGLIALLLWSGDHTTPKVRDFSWQNQQIGSEDTAFILTFNRPMDWQSVAENLQIQPPLTGKFSWSGRRFAYTLTQVIPYGTDFQIQLKEAQEAVLGAAAQPKSIQPFVSQFHSRDRAFIYLGVEPAEAGRLILYNLTQKQKTVLTPPNLVVTDFQAYPTGDRILFTATEQARLQQTGVDLKLYTVSTGLPQQLSRNNQRKAGQIKLILDNQDYQILKFDLSTDGQAIVVQRIERQNIGNVSLWLLKSDSEPQLLSNVSGGDFWITPDSTALAITQGQGLAVLPLDPQAGTQPLDFLAQYGTVLSFAKDGSAAAMVKFNSDYTRSLFLVTNQGAEKELLRTKGSILSGEFDPSNETLYCLLTRVLPGADYQEEPYIAAIELETAEVKPLLRLPGQQQVQLSLAPDGSALVFDQTVQSASTQPQVINPASPAPRQPAAEQALTSNLWLLPTNQLTDRADPQVTPTTLTTGLHPRWLP